MFDKYNSLVRGSSYLRNARMAGYSDYLLKIPLLNISSDQYICYGDDLNRESQSLNAAIENTIMVFWSAPFNSDYTYNYNAYKGVAGVNTYIGWQALSQIDPMFIYNVDWIKMESNLLETINNMKGCCNVQSKTSIHYDKLLRVFTQPADLGVDEKINRKRQSKRTARLFYDITQGIYLDEKLFLHVDDPIMWGKHTAYIDSFIGFSDSDRIRMIRLQLENGKYITTRYNDRVKTYLMETVKKIRYEEQGTLKNGVTVKEGDIVSMTTLTGSNIYRKVHFIRKTKDGMTEARMGTAFYLLENTEGSVLDLESPVYYDMTIVKGKQYIYYTPSKVPIHRGAAVTYDGMNISNDGQLNMEFTTVDKGPEQNTYRINIDDRTMYPSRRLYAKDECEPLSPIFCSGRKILCIRDENNRLVAGYAWRAPDGGIIYDEITHHIAKPTINEVSKYVLSKDKIKFKLEGGYVDVEFTIGDKVVYANWENPIDMLVVRTITSFKIDTDNQSLSFILSDKDGKLTEVPYISRGGETANIASSVQLGRIRKITNHFNGVDAGTKIIAEKSYIPHFPKKDANIIIGFITDTGGNNPLVLCSNCCTLWFNDMMSNFKRVILKSTEWSKISHAPIDISKIKPQQGDLVRGTSDYHSAEGWIVIRKPGSKALRISSLNNIAGYSNNYTLNSYTVGHITFDCIPNPRISPSHQGKMSIKRGWPNFHGLFIENALSQYQFLEDERSLFYVSDSR